MIIIYIKKKLYWYTVYAVYKKTLHLKYVYITYIKKLEKKIWNSNISYIIIKAIISHGAWSCIEINGPIASGFKSG